MYAERIVEERLSLARTELGFLPEYHSVDEVIDFEQNLRKNNKYVYDDHGLPIATRDLVEWERKWMLNEQTLVKCDHAYALTRYCFVKSEEGVVMRFIFRVAQRILFNVIADMELNALAIEIMILKARQLGMSTLVELLIMLRVCFGSGVNAVVASAEVEKSGLMASMLFMAYQMLPVWMRPRYTARSTEGDQRKLVFGTLNTMLSIQHGNKMKGGIAQGWTPTVYHLSECAFFKNPELQIDAGLHKAVHPSPSVFGILESSGSGDQGWWPETWRYSKANWPQSRLNPLFLPWFCGLDLYPKPAFLRKSPVPRNFYDKRLPDTKEHVAKAEAYVATHKAVKQHLCVPHPELGRERRDWWVDGKMPIEQQWFWECGHEEAKSKGREDLWYQEMAGDDVEALQRSAESVFGRDTVVEIETRRKKEFEAYGLCGQSIEDHHEPAIEDINYNKQRIAIRYESRRGEIFRWELIPLKLDMDLVEHWRRTNPEAFKDYAHGKLFIFHHPQEGVDYSFGIDTSNGIGSDSTVISGCSIGQRGAPDVQAAEFRSRYVSHVEAYAFAMCICGYYAKYMGNAMHREPLVAAEQLRAVGDTCQLQMRKMGYSRFHRMIRYDKANINKANSNQMGWMTNSWSRPILIDGYKHCLINGWYQLNSPWTLYEIEHFEQHLTASGKPKPEHEEGENDDGIFAGAISTQIAHDTQSMTERTKKKYMGEAGISRPNIDLRPYGGHVIPTRGNNVVSDLDIVLL